jgi:two-component system sensor histidine kinase KdpD
VTVDVTSGSVLAAPRSRLAGLALALASVALTTLLIYPLAHVAPVVSTGVAYLPAVLMISIFWGLGLGVLTAIGSALAFNYFHIPPTGQLQIARAQDSVALVVLLVAAVIVSWLADIARSRAIEAERRRSEADLAAQAATDLLGGVRVADGLPQLERHLALTLGAAWAAIDLEGAPARGAPGDGAPELAIALEQGGRRMGTARLPADLDRAARERFDARVRPVLEALLAAGLEREALQRDAVEAQALRRSDEVKTAIIRAVSHDFRSPITGILTAGEALESTTLADGDRRELAGSVVHEAHRLAALVDKLLDLSHLQSGTAEPRTDWCAVEEVVRDAADHVRGGEFRIQIAPDLPLVRADAAQLERALQNLLENAVRHSGGHPVVVRARVVAGRVVIRVVDRGPGIAPQQLEHVFDAFYRVPGAGGDHHGAGLGLAIARGFVQANGGRLHAESVVGQGTAFIVELPLSEAPAVAEAAP